MIMPLTQLSLREEDGSSFRNPLLDWKSNASGWTSKLSFGLWNIQEDDLMAYGWQGETVDPTKTSGMGGSHKTSPDFFGQRVRFRKRRSLFPPMTETRMMYVRPQQRFLSEKVSGSGTKKSPEALKSTVAQDTCLLQSMTEPSKGSEKAPEPHLKSVLGHLSPIALSDVGSDRSVDQKRAI